MSIGRVGNQQLRRRSGYLQATSVAASNATGPTADLPRRNERLKELMTFGVNCAPAHHGAVVSHRAGG